MMRFWVPTWYVLSTIVGLLAVGGAQTLKAQHGGLDYDTSWYEPGMPYIQIDVAEDGVYQITGSDIAEALPDGQTLDSIDPSTIQLFEHGTEVPIDLSAEETLTDDDALTFVGLRNRGDDELWAYNDNANWQSSDHRSLYTDTTTYWLTWGQTTEGMRYEASSHEPTSPTSTVRDTAWAEHDTRYYFGRSGENFTPIYSSSEGYYWHRFSHSGTAERIFEYTLPVSRRDAAASTPLTLTVRLDAETSTCHRVEATARLTDGNGMTYESLDEVSWQGQNRATIETTVDPSRIPDDGLDVRLISYNDGFDSSCPPPSSTPNRVLLDWIAADYDRTLAARPGEDWQHWTLASTGSQTFELSDHNGTPIVYGPETATKTEGETVTVVAEDSDDTFWAVGSNGYQSPEGMEPHIATDWVDTDLHSADYVLITPPALEESAQAMADYRSIQGGYETVVVPLDDIFAAFDYGRPTPIAIRRFVHSTQSWSNAPDFLALWGDAQHPIYTNLGGDERVPDWSIPSFGYSPSDGWYAMQQSGPSDWSEFLAIGRIPVRTNAQGELFIDKIEEYESAPLDLWQQRMMLVAGGTSASEQQSLQFYSNRWGEWATGTEDSLYVAGMDTTRYYKQVDDPLDSTFRDSLAVDLERGAGWLNYFGHSGAQTWEIVTDPPEEFNNAGRLPVVVSLGCRTGAFAGRTFGNTSTGSLGERLVVGQRNDDGTPVAGSENGGIAHWGTSALGNRIPSARLNDELIERVFQDTVRVLGLATQEGKAEIADRFGTSTTYRDHLMQYGLLGDPATEIAIAGKPDFHITSDAIRLSSAAPIPGEDLDIEVRLRNRGLVAHDSVTVALTWTRPDGSTNTKERRVPRFAVERVETFTLDVDDEAVGTNQFRVAIDPENEYDEEVLTNNEATREQVIFDTGVELISPIDQHAVNTSTPTLRMNLVRQANFAEDLTVEMQVDTVDTFDSSALQTHTESVSGALLEWTPSPLDDATVHYWRARLVIDPNAEPIWKTGRFIVDTERPDVAWNQRDALFATNTTDDVRFDAAAQGWAFDTFTNNVSIYSERGRGENTHGFVINGSANYLYLSFGFGLLVMDGTTGEVRDAQAFPTYDLRSDLIGDNGDQEEAIEAMAEFLDTVPEDGDYIFLRTRHLGRESGITIPDEVKDMLRNMGTDPADEPYSAAIDTLDYRHVWALKTQKGDPAETEELVTDPSAEPDERNINGLDHEIAFARASGTVQTPPIGPASGWGEIEWHAESPFPDSEMRVDVRSASDSTLLISDLTGLEVAHPLDEIDAETHPYIFLDATLRNEPDRVPPQLRAWSVDYAGVPELILDPTPLAELPDTLQEGADLPVETRVVNWGSIEASEVTVRYNINDAGNVTETATVDTLSTLAPDASYDSNVTISTLGRVGTNALNVRVQQDRYEERIDINNATTTPFTVTADQTIPAVKVRVEGRELPANPEPLVNLTDPALPYVSTRPTFEIVIEDDNELRPIENQELVDVYLNDEQIEYDGEVLTFEPATDEQDARVLYEPDLSGRDSTYTLRVEAEDASGNELEEAYQTHVRVEEDQQIDVMYPYPNPMVDHTQFAFRIRGGTTAPSDLRLRIYTVSGRLVRELRGEQANDGAGLRSTDWNMIRWDGRDADGDRVATGVYLYHVRMEGDEGTHEGEVGRVAVIR